MAAALEEHVVPPPRPSSTPLPETRDARAVLSGPRARAFTEPVAAEEISLESSLDSRVDTPRASGEYPSELVVQRPLASGEVRGHTSLHAIRHVIQHTFEVTRLCNPNTRDPPSIPVRGRIRSCVERRDGRIEGPQGEDAQERVCEGRL